MQILKKLRTLSLAAACLLPLMSMPAAAADSVDLSTGLVTIGSIVVGATEYKNVVIEIASIVSFSTAPATLTADKVDLSTGRLTIAAITVAGTTYTNVEVTVKAIRSVGSSAPAPTTPVTITVAS